MTAHTNSWDTLTNGVRHLPCPKCMPDAKINTTPCPKDLNGVLRLVGQRISTGKYIYSCYSCSYEEER